MLIKPYVYSIVSYLSIKTNLFQYAINAIQYNILMNLLTSILTFTNQSVLELV